MIEKKSVHKLAVLCIAFYFIVDALQKLMRNNDEVWMLKHKTHQIQTALSANSLLLFDFYQLFETFGSVLLICIAAIELVSGMLFVVYESEQRLFYAYLLVGCLCFDSLAMHFPFTETQRNFGHHNSHFSANLLIAASTLMAAGFENEDDD